MTPTSAIVTVAQQEHNVHDEQGRVIAIKRPTALDTLRLIKAAGPILSQNEAWMAIAGLAASVTAIDGVPIPSPASEAQIESLVSKLGDHGLAAVSAFFDALDTPSGKDSDRTVGN